MKFYVASDDLFDANTPVLRAQMVKYCEIALNDSSLPQDEYEELLKLCLIFFGGMDEEEKFLFNFLASSIMRDGWQKPYIALESFFFSNSLPLNKKQMRILKELALFVSLVYVRFWHEAPLAVNTPFNDLLLKELNQFPVTAVAKAAITTFSRHLWYFAEILVGFSLCDDRIESKVKARMVANLKLPKLTDAVKRIDHLPEPYSPMSLHGFMIVSSQNQCIL